MKVSLVIGYHYYGPPNGQPLNPAEASLKLVFKLGAPNMSDQELMQSLNITFFPGTTSVKELTITIGM